MALDRCKVRVVVVLVLLKTNIPKSKSQHPKHKKRMNLVSNESCGSSVRFSGGSLLCCDSCIDSDVRQGNNRLWNKVENDVQNLIWKNIKSLGVTCNKGDGVYVKIIKEI